MKHWAFVVALAIVATMIVILNVSSDFRRSQFLSECVKQNPADFCAKVWDGVK